MLGQVTAGWENVYRVCVEPRSQRSEIYNLTNGVIRLFQEVGISLEEPCPNRFPPGTTRSSTPFVGRLAPAARQSDGSYLVSAGQCVRVIGTNGWRLGVRLNYVASSSVFLASSFAKWAVEKLQNSVSPLFGILNSLTSCGNGASTLYHQLGFGTQPATPMTLLNLMDKALDLVGCRQVVTGCATC